MVQRAPVLLVLPMVLTLLPGCGTDPNGVAGNGGGVNAADGGGKGGKHGGSGTGSAPGTGGASWAGGTGGTAPEPDPDPPPSDPPPSDPPPDPGPYAGPATSDVWKMGGVFVYDPKTFPASAYGPVLKANHFGWVALQIIDGSTEKWACSAEPCGTDTAEGWIRSWRPWVKWVGAWGVNRANSSEAAVKAEAQLAVDLIDAYDGSSSYVDFFIADAEAEYEYSKCGSCVSASDWWAAKFRDGKPNLQASVSSYGRTDLADIYWMSWKSRGFHWLPQAYWNDANMAAAFKPSACVDVGRVCPGSADATKKGFNCTGSPTDCPCWPTSTIHPTIGYGWGQNPPTIDEYIADLGAAHAAYGSVGFSVYEGQYVPPSSDAWSKLGQAIATGGIAIVP